jgi:putative phosphotransacetylase
MEKFDEAAIKAIVDEVLRRLKAKEEGIAVGVSNRHLHLAKEDFESLFGPNREMVKIKDLSQPGEFAAAETVNLIGPRGEIKSVRVLGPCRANTQVEISRTDSYLLGIKVPVRESGRIEGTPGVVIEGPYGKISIEKGLIVARRHLHLDPESARKYGVKNGDTILVKTEGERGVAFDNVLARVSDKYALEMHLDTDEANAADIKSGDLVYVVPKAGKRTEEAEKKAGEKARIITRADVMQAKFDGSMRIMASGGTKITPLAKDAAGELGVEILCIWQT